MGCRQSKTEETIEHINIKNLEVKIPDIPKAKDDTPWPTAKQAFHEDRSSTTTRRGIGSALALTKQRSNASSASAGSRDLVAKQNALDLQMREALHKRCGEGQLELQRRFFETVHAFEERKLQHRSELLEKTMKRVTEKSEQDAAFNDLLFMKCSDWPGVLRVVRICWDADKKIQGLQYLNENLVTGQFDWDAADREAKSSSRFSISRSRQLTVSFSPNLAELCCDVDKEGVWPLEKQAIFDASEVDVTLTPESVKDLNMCETGMYADGKEEFLVGGSLDHYLNGIAISGFEKGRCWSIPFINLVGIIACRIQDLHDLYRVFESGFSEEKGPHIHLNKVTTMFGNKRWVELRGSKDVQWMAKYVVTG